MKRLLALMIIIIGIALACPVLAQPAPSTGGTDSGLLIPPPGTNRSRMRSAASGTFMLMHAYNPKTVTAAKGAIQGLRTMPFKSQLPGAMLAATLKTEQGNIMVFLAPAVYLSEQKIVLKNGDEVEVTGSKVTLGKQPPSIIVRDLKVGDKSAVLRDEGGMPLWLGAQPRTPVK